MTWNVHAQGDADEYVILTDDKRWVIAFRCNGELTEAQQRDIIPMIAAAPDLLEAAAYARQEIREVMHRHGKTTALSIADNALTSAIAKAKGSGTRTNAEHIVEWGKNDAELYRAFRLWEAATWGDIVAVARSVRWVKNAYQKARIAGDIKEPYSGQDILDAAKLVLSEWEADQ